MDNLDRIIDSTRALEPEPAELAAAGERVRAKLFGAGADGIARIKGCSDFRALLPSYLSKTISDARRMLVEERRWMTAEEFNAQLGLCQFLPGPNVINLAVVVGKRYGGLAGAIVAPVGLLAGPLAIVLLLALLYDRYGSLPLAQSMLRGIAAVGVGLLFAMAWRMSGAIKEKLFFLPFAALTVIAIAGLRWPMPMVMVAGLMLSGGIAYWRLGRK